MKGKISKLVTATIATFLVTALSVSAVFADVTWDPNKKSSNAAILSENNMQAEVTGMFTNVVSTEYKSTGKWYWEVEIIKGNTMSIGLTYPTYDMNTVYLGASNDSYGYYSYGQLHHGSGSGKGGYEYSFGTGDTIGVALDLDNKQIEYYKNGVNQGVAFKDLLSGQVYAAVSGSAGGTNTFKAKFKATDFKYSVPTGFLAFDTPAPITKDETITIETPINEIEIGKEFTTDVVLHNGVNVCAEDVVVNYDKNLFEYLGFEEAAGFKVYKEMPVDGSVRFITASNGKANAINGDKTFVKLKFRAKQEGTGKVDAMTARIADNGTIEKDLKVDLCGEKIIKVTGIKDVNRTGKFTLLDLGIDAWYHGMKAEETDKSKYDCDVVVDSNIDDLDLSSIVTAMLANTEYRPHQ